MLNKSYHYLIYIILIIAVLFLSIKYVEITMFLIMPIFVIGNLILFRKKLKNIIHVYIISLFFVFVYSIVPLIIYLFPYKFKYEITNILENNTNIFKANLLLIIGFSSYFYGSLKLLIRKERRKIFLNKYKHIDIFNKSLFNVGCVFLLIGCISLYLYSGIYGGISNLIRLGALIRAGIIADSKFLFLSRFILFAPISSWIFLSLKKDYYRPKLSKMLFVIGLAIIIIYSFITASRQALLMNIIILVYIDHYDSNKSFKDYFKDIRILILFFFILIFILYGKNIFANIAYGSKINRHTNRFFSFIGEFAHPYISFLTSIDYINEYFKLRGVIDFYYGLIELLPKKLLGIKGGKSISYLNTFLIFNEEKGFYPPGMIGYFYYSFGSVGIILGSFLYNKISNLFINICKSLESESSIFNGLYIFFIISFSQYIMSGDPRVYMKSYFIYYLSFIIILLIMKNTNSRFKFESK